MNKITNSLPAPVITNEFLDTMRFRTDPLADATVARILGEWPAPVAVPPAEFAVQWEAQWQKLRILSAIFEQWTDNRSLVQWNGEPTATLPAIPADMVAALRDYVQAANTLPDWADPEKIDRAEQLFIDYGVLSVMLLFCSSLPECYVIPDLAAVLNATGQLTENAEYRIRSTGAMIFPVMMRGGLTQPEGAGIAQVFKVRLIHAIVRNLILRGNPQAALAVYESHRSASGAGEVAPIAALHGAQNKFHALFAFGWNIGARGLPNNQEELAYTLLTFHYVYLRSMRRMGLALPPQDEQAYLHAWNVMGHFLGIEPTLMPSTMTEAEAMFTLIQARGRKTQMEKQHDIATAADPRPQLGNALMDAMKSAIPLWLIKPFPVMLTRFLCGPATSKILGLNGWISPLSRFLFTITMTVIRVIDFLGRLVSPGFSLSRLLMRVLGYRLMCKLLMDQTRPLKAPLSTRQNITATIAAWGHDPKAPRWMNALEDFLTAKGDWKPLKTAAAK